MHNKLNGSTLSTKLNFVVNEADPTSWSTEINEVGPMSPVEYGENCSLESLCWSSKPCRWAQRLEAKEQFLE